MLLFLGLLAPVVVNVSTHGAIHTLGAALDEVRRLRTANSGLIEIRIAPGAYRVEKTLEITQADGALRIVGDSHRLPRLVGARQLANWQPVRDEQIASRLKSAARANVLECDLDAAGVSNLGEMKPRGFGMPSADAGLELFANGRPMQLARYPNPDAADGGWLRIASTPSASSIKYKDDEPKSWLLDADIWAMGYWQFDWAESYEPVRKLDAAAHTVDFGNAHFSYPPAAGRRFFFLNVLEELDEPGEWYLDRPKHKLYFWPPSPILGLDVVASTLDGPMFRINGDSDVEIQHLDLEDGRGGGIVIEGGRRNWIRHCVIRNFGRFGVDISGASDSGVSACDLTGLGEGGISLSGGDRKSLTPAHLVASDNHLWSYSRWCRTYRPAISLAGVGNAARNNRIHDAPHEAILVSGNDHVIELNDIARVCTETGDAGAVYMGRDTTMRGVIVRFNRFSDMAPKVNTAGNYTEVMGVYLDDCWAGTLVFGNIFDMKGVGIMLGGGRDNSVINNVFLNCSPAIHFDARGKSWAAKYFTRAGEWSFLEKIDAMNVTQPPYSTEYPKLATVASTDVAFPGGCVIDSNVCLGGEWIRLLDNLSTKDFEDKDNVVEAGLGTMLGLQRARPRSFRPIPTERNGLLSKDRPSANLR